MSKFNTKVAGIDVAKAKLDVAIHGQAATLTVVNGPSGFAELTAFLKKSGVQRVGMEASGGYERAVARHLEDEGFKVAMLQPIQVKAFAKAQLRRAKNDLLDAALIAAFTALLAKERGPTDWRLAPLSDHLTFIEQIEDDIRRAKTRLEHQRDARIRLLIEEDIARLSELREDELARLVNAIRVHGDLAVRLDLVESIDGLGERTAVTLVVRMPELGALEREEAAALAGLAPYDDDSGARQGVRKIEGGRKKVRRALYLAALPACHRWNPKLVALRERLQAKGKKGKLILVACARKLLIYANTVLKRGTPWTKTAPAT